MNKKLELRLIESGYDPTNAKNIDIKEAGRIITEELYQDKKINPSGMILFDGMSEVIVRTGLCHSIMDQSVIAINDGAHDGGLYIYSASSDTEGKRSSFFVGREDANNDTKKPIKISYTNEYWPEITISNEEDNSIMAKIEIHPRGTKILYLPSTERVEGDKLFWKYIAKEVGLRLQEIEPLYTDKSPLTPWYSTKDKQTGIELVLGTRWRVYAVRSKFPYAKTTVYFNQLIKGLPVSLQTLDGKWIGDKQYGRGQTFETHIDKGRGDQVLEYLKNILNRKEDRTLDKTHEILTHHELAKTQLKNSGK